MSSSTPYGDRCGAERVEGGACMNRVQKAGIRCTRHGGPSMKGVRHVRAVCQARHVTGKPCQTLALPGLSVCHFHVRTAREVHAEAAE